MLRVVDVLDPPSTSMLVYHKNPREYLSRCLCALTTLFQRPLNTSLSLGRPILQQIGVYVSGHIKARIVDKF